MRVNFEVEGATARDLREAADIMLATLDPDIDANDWLVSFSVYPMVLSGAGQVQMWKAEVTAVDKTDRQL